VQINRTSNEEIEVAVKKSILIVGASRGLGFALTEEFLTRDWNVVATSRGSSSGLASLQKRHPESLALSTVEITDIASLRALRERLTDRKFDVLFVTAGICKANELSPLQVEEKDFIDMMVTNALSPMRIIELFQDRVANDGVIAAMSSEIGSITNSTGFWELYSSSKAALNMLMKSFAAHHPNDPHALLLIAPGWVKTDMGTQDAILEISDSIPLVADLVERSAGARGVHFVDRHGKTIPW
jgi:NAD(P)-dependent dehydrogenase (short-subunit alcohol dehydrogenase family)